MSSYQSVDFDFIFFLWEKIIMTIEFQRCVDSTGFQERLNTLVETVIV